MIGTLMLVCAMLCLPLWLGKVGPNPFYGYVSKFARSSPRHWQHMNRFAVALFLPFFCALAVGEIFLNDKVLVWVLLGGSPLLLGLCFLEEWRQKFMERRRQKKSTP